MTFGEPISVLGLPPTFATLSKRYVMACWAKTVGVSRAKVKRSLFMSRLGYAEEGRTVEP